jgi:YVTN family beta-propeller protein
LTFRFLGMRTRGLLLFAAAIVLSSRAVLHPHMQGDGLTSKAATITTMNRPAAPTAKIKTGTSWPMVMMAGGPGGIYEETSAGRFSPAVQGALDRVYVPNIRSNSVDVIDPATLTVIDRFRVGASPQHVVPSWDLRTLWVTGSKVRHSSGSLTPIDPTTGRPGRRIDVPDAYNMYFTPDGRLAIVVAESLKRLEFRDPQTMALEAVLPVAECRGINHADFSMDGRYAIFSCEFGGNLVKVDIAEQKVLGTLRLSKRGMPQDVRISPDGKTFYVADMMADGVFLIDGDDFVETGFIPTGIGAHGLYPSRDAMKLYVSNRGSHRIRGRRNGPGSISIIDFATRKVEGVWPIPGGGSPDMGNVSADGKTLWLSGRYDDVVYAIDTSSGNVTKIPVGREPHGLTVWPQPGRYSLGHTGNMR